jgi:hypothetical protein
MSKIAIATLQTVWDCRWSQPGCRAVDVEGSPQPESAWVCIRTGCRRAVTNAECEACPHWEQADQSGR